MCAIRHKAICAALCAGEISALDRISRRRLVPAGQTILGEGEAHTIFANIVSGVVKLTKTLDDGRQHIIGLLFASDFLGRAFRRDNPYFAEAATDVELCVFPAAGFEKLLPDHPGLEHRLFQYTLTELDACQEWMLLLARKRAEERVASFLLMIAKRVPSVQCPARGKQSRVPFSIAVVASGNLGLPGAYHRDGKPPDDAAQDKGRHRAGQLPRNRHTRCAGAARGGV